MMRMLKAMILMIMKIFVTMVMMMIMMMVYIWKIKQFYILLSVLRHELICVCFHVCFGPVFYDNTAIALVTGNTNIDFQQNLVSKCVDIYRSYLGHYL